MDFSPNKKTSEPTQEHILEELLLSLPKRVPQELVELWTKKVESLVPMEAVNEINRLLNSRQVVKEKIFTKIYEIESPVIREEILHCVSTIEKTFGDTNYFIGNGSVAEVYEMPYASHVCVKYLVNRDMAREHGNNFREETEHLANVYGLRVGSVRAPHLYFNYESDFGSCFGMEKIEGKSLNLIIENPASIDFLDVIKKQDVQKVIQDFKTYVIKMHEERKLVHRDLTSRNIMVDRSGDWYVIDFGRAKAIEIGDASTEESQRTDISTVENSIRELFKVVLTLSDKRDIIKESDH